MAKLIVNKEDYLSFLYILYILNFSVVTIFFPEINLQNIRIITLFIFSLFFIRIASNRINLLSVLLVLACALSLVFNDPASVFNTTLRFVFFVIVFFCLGLIIKPKFSSEDIIDLSFISKINRWIIVISFVLFLFGLGAYYGTGNFSGLLSHANILGPIAGLVCIERFIFYFKEKKTWQSFSVFLIAFFIVVLTGARAALFTLVLSILCVGIYIFRVKFVIWSFILSFFFIGAFFVLKSYNSALVLEEHQGNVYRPRTIFEKGFDNTRIKIWEERVDEFIANPIFGSGFSAVNTDIIPEESASYDLETGSIQPGSGYLGVLSMTGVLGFITFLMIMTKSIMVLIKRRYYFTETNYLLIISTLIFISLHSIFEGYILSSGSIMFFIFWITIAYIFNKREN